MDISKYVVDNIDKALEQGWVQVYYQPVVRSLTGALCSMESLARWNDPEIGFLMPAYFVDALEKSEQIHKLDCYVVERVCEDLQCRMRAGLPIVPVSVNFSRLDFSMCDMLSVVERAVRKHEIPREYLHIEITESMFVSDEALMRRMIDSFHEAGYEVWMDDFGSGYSSLTLLKDYHFDLVKLDMNFLSSFTERSKDILRSVIAMAKDIGIKTLAEGVETEEELDYLKGIGCGKIQGNYFGRPGLINDVFIHLQKRGIPIEKGELWPFYEAACIHVRPTDLPLEIVEDDGVNFKTLFMNKAYQEQIFDDYPDLEEADRRIYHTPSPLLQKYRSFADLMEKTGKEETFYYTENGNYLRFRGKALAEHNGHHILKGSIVNISHDPDAEKEAELDFKLRELNQLFDVVHLLEPKKDRITPLLGHYKYYSNHIAESIGMRERMSVFMAERIHPADLERYRTFIDYDTLRERVKTGKRGYISAIFSILQEEGDYQPEEILIMMLPGSGGNEYLYCMKYCSDSPSAAAVSP